MTTDPTGDDVPACLICSLDDAPDSSRVFRDDVWAAELAPGYEVPGWFFLRARRHAELITGLDTRELETLAGRARDLTEAIRTVTGAEAVYFMSFGESYRHYHALVAARGPEIPPASRGGYIVGLLPQAIDRARAAELVGPIRDAYERLSGGAVGASDDGVARAITAEPGMSFADRSHRGRPDDAVVPAPSEVRAR